LVETVNPGNPFAVILGIFNYVPSGFFLRRRSTVDNYAGFHWLADFFQLDVPLFLNEGKGMKLYKAESRCYISSSKTFELKFK
jgi:hypothetical protein